MRTIPFLIGALLLLFALTQTWNEGFAVRTAADAQVLSWDSVAGRGPLQTGNNTTPSFFDLVPIIIFILVGVGIAIVLVAAGLWIAGRRRRGTGPEGGSPGEGDVGKEGENDEWGASWEN